MPCQPFSLLSVIPYKVKMVDRNIYKEEIDFAALALQSPSFNKLLVSIFVGKLPRLFPET